MEVFGGSGDPMGTGDPAFGAGDPFGGGWGDPTGQNFGGQTVGGGFTGTGNVDGGIADAIAASMAVGNTLTQDQTTAKATKTFNNTNVQPRDARTNLTNLLQDLSRSSPTNMVMSLLANAVGNPPNEMMSQVTLDQGLRDQYSGLGTSLATDMGHPHTGGPMLGSPAFANESMMSVPMSGFGAQLGIATARDPHTGLNMGPGRPGEPGDVNPFSGVAYADPGDPYIRKKRGTEIVGMIGP